MRRTPRRAPGIEADAQPIEAGVEQRASLRALMADGRSGWARLA
jgi:hypothetical protein